MRIDSQASSGDLERSNNQIDNGDRTQIAFIIGLFLARKWLSESLERKQER